MAFVPRERLRIDPDMRPRRVRQLPDGPAAHFDRNEGYAIYGTVHTKKKPASVETKAGFKLCWRNVKQRVRCLASSHR